MLRFATLQAMFKRYRRPGDIVFALVFLIFSVLMLAQLGSQTTWKKGGALFAQPAFWPAVSLTAMAGFAFLHFVSSWLSPRIPGRWSEVGFWIRSLEYVLWFMLYVWAVPLVGYLGATVVLAVFLTLRSGYRSLAMILSAAGAAVVVVLIFKTFLQVKIPGGAVYEFLPNGLRGFMLTYF